MSLKSNRPRLPTNRLTNSETIICPPCALSHNLLATTTGVPK